MENILEGNILIAEFMGERIDNRYKKPVSPMIYGKEGSKQTKYHSSWDWLMPVVEKIEKTNMITIWGNHCDLSAEKDTTSCPPIDQFSGIPKIEAVYKCVIGFIKWYNSNKK